MKSVPNVHRYERRVCMASVYEIMCVCVCVCVCVYDRGVIIREREYVCV
jgi:hypothetical protein